MKARAIIETEEFKPKELLITFETADEMARFYTIFNHVAITEGILEGDVASNVIRAELTELFPNVYELSNNHWDDMLAIIKPEWRSQLKGAK